MKIILLFAFLPTLLLAILYTNTYNTTEVPDLIMTGRFVVKIVNQTKPLQIITNSPDLIKGMVISQSRYALEISRDNPILNPYDVQVLVSSKTVINIKGSSGVRISSDQKDLRIHTLTLTDQAAANFTSLISSYIAIEVQSSSKLNIYNLTAGTVLLSATQNSTFNTDLGQIEMLDATADHNASVRFGAVFIKEARFMEDRGGKIDAVAIKVVRRQREQNNINVFGMTYEDEGQGFQAFSRSDVAGGRNTGRN